jgi:hypothetical protein
MKLQILYVMKYLTQSKRGKTISFFNELDIGTGTMLKNPGSIPRPLFHFLTSLT